MLSESHLVEHSEGGRTAWLPEDHTVLVKLLWLSDVRGNPCLESDDAASAVFGDSSISVEAFDRWWTIERLVSTDSTDNMALAVPFQKRNIRATGNDLVDSWMMRAVDA